MVNTAKECSIHICVERCIELGYYYPLRSTVKRDEFCTYVYFLNVTLLSRLVSLLANETLTFRARN